ncbi:MAG: hypothetical protein HY002_00070, partial [Candidatus Rokubacteria bacterium]|nr:hypothetical protein [Candidatus Rokubacteria bacterium]
MRGIRSVLLLLAGLAGLPFALPAEAQAPRAERPTYALGEKWIRNDGNYALTRIEDDLYIFTAGPGQEIHLTRNLTLARVRTARSLVTFDAAPVLHWPLTVGQVRRTPGTWRPPPYISPNVANGDFTWKVEAYEDVRVAAGTFKAYRISLAIEPAPTTYGEHARAVDLTFWYAPEARQLVKAESRDVPSLAFEVVRLDRPAPPPVAAQPPPSPPGATPPAPAAPRPAPAPASTPPATATPAPAPPRPTPAPPPVPSGAALQITISLPPDRVDQQTTALAGVVSGGVGVSWVVVALNGEEVSRLGGPTPLRALAVNVSLKLREGKNTLVITAGGADGSTRQDVRTITYEPPSVAATVPAPAPPAPLIAPDRWAVVIGVG